MMAPPPTAAPMGPLIRRKTKAVDSNKCCILSHIRTIQPPQGRHWDDNDGLRPSYDTLPTWRQQRDEGEPPESTMNLTYKEYLNRNPFLAVAASAASTTTASTSTTTTATPVPAPGMLHHGPGPLPFLHQPPNGHMMAPRQSPHSPHPQMAMLQPLQPQHPMSHGGPFNNDQRGMMPPPPYASPRLMYSPAPVPPAPFTSPGNGPPGSQFAPPGPMYPFQTSDGGFNSLMARGPSYRDYPPNMRFCESREGNKSQSWIPRRNTNKN
jgi:hypothetical protein